MNSNNIYLKDWYLKQGDSMVTIKDIAKMTGVSTTTVSNVLNGKSGAASQAKSKEIFEVAEKLQYIPNSLAKSLKQKKTNNIGIITEDLTVFNTPEIVDGIDEFCENNGYEIILANMRLYKRYNNDFTDTPKHQELFDTVISNMMAKQVEGMIYVGYHCREISYLPFRINVPFVYTYCFPKEPIYPSVLFDDEKAGYDVANLLISKGHKKIGVISGPKTSYNAQSRLNGFRRALEEHGIAYDPDTTVIGKWDKISGYNNADTLLDKKVTAIFAFNDMMIIGVNKRCKDRNLTVGKDISLIGYDNLDFVSSISSVEAPLNEMGRKSAEIVFKQINHRRIADKRILLPCIVRDRQSVGTLK